MDFTDKKILPAINSTIMMGSKKVESKNVLLRTLVTYSRFIMSQILFMMGKIMELIKFAGTGVHFLCLLPV